MVVSELFIFGNCKCQILHSVQDIEMATSQDGVKEKKSNYRQLSLSNNCDLLAQPGKYLFHPLC